MGPKWTLLVSTLIISLAFGVLAGCGGEEEPATPVAKPSPPAPPAPTRAPVVEKDPPKTFMEQLETSVDLPDFYPKDAPVYPNTKPNSAGWQGGRVSAIFHTKDDADEVVAFVTSSLNENGWSNVQHVEIPDGSAVQGFKSDEDRTISVLVAEVEEKGEAATVIAVSTDP
jgi:hypothetical protein